MNTLFQQLGLIGAIIMPLWNIPLIVRILKRRTSEDISLAWLFGVWGCMLLMLPSGLQSKEIQLKAFTICNVVFFGGVVAVVLFFRKQRKPR